VVYVFQTGEHSEIVIKRIKQIGYMHPSRLMQDAKSETIRYFLDHPNLLLKNTLDAELAQEDTILKNPRSTSQEIGLTSSFTRNHALKQAVSEKLQDLKAAVAIPLFVGKQPIGLIFLSEKKSGEPYSEDDLMLLETVGSQAINAIQKAKFYDDDKAKSEFVSIASHELFTPIAAIDGYLDMILNEHLGEVDAKARGYLEKVFASSRRLAFLVKDLLSVSRIEAGTIKLSLQSLDLAKTIGEAIDQLQLLADEKHLKLSLSKPYGPLPLVLADYDRLMEVLINLIGNSIKYTPEGSVTISAEEMNGRFVRVDVTDTGIGMSKEARAHLFEKFYRISSPETTGITGTGLGLFITKSIMEKMGGDIFVKSKPGEGSTFSITIPIFQVETAKPNPKST
jgi:signal transduction histidine kinase